MPTEVKLTTTLDNDKIDESGLTPCLNMMLQTSAVKHITPRYSS